MDVNCTMLDLSKTVYFLCEVYHIKVYLVINNDLLSNLSGH